MSSLTIPLQEEFEEKLEKFPWVNWSAVVKQELLKKEIFERFIKTGTLSGEDQQFCDSINWYPVDWLPLREEFIKELKKAEKEPRGKAMTAKEFNKWCDEL